MLIKKPNMGDRDRENVNAENIHIVRRILDDFERNEFSSSRTKSGRNASKNRRFLVGKISRSDSLIHKCRIQPKGHKVFHEKSFCPGKARSLQSVSRSHDSLSYWDVFENRASVENTNANSPKNLERRQSHVGNSVGKTVDDAKLAEEARKHQEKVKKNVREVRLGLMLWKRHLEAVSATHFCSISKYNSRRYCFALLICTFGFCCCRCLIPFTQKG